MIVNVTVRKGGVELAEVTVDVTFQWPERGEIVTRDAIDYIAVKSAGCIHGCNTTCPEWDEMAPPPEWLKAILEEYCWTPNGMRQILDLLNRNCQNLRWEPTYTM